MKNVKSIIICLIAYVGLYILCLFIVQRVHYEYELNKISITNINDMAYIKYDNYVTKLLDEGANPVAYTGHSMSEHDFEIISKNSGFSNANALVILDKTTSMVYIAVYNEDDSESYDFLNVMYNIEKVE